MSTLLRFFMICGVLVLAVPSGASAQSCAAGPATLQILGSAGPAFNKDRASSSYLLWIDGKARMLVDMGGGAHLRFAQSGAKLSDLALIGISHLHPDHVSDLPALLWLSHLQRKEPLPIAGPSPAWAFRVPPETTSRLILRRFLRACSTRGMAPFK
jgi:ribonuclease BN (tRNA processing enzyme)